MSVRRLLLGDWHPWLRDPIDLVRYAFVLATIVWAAAGGEAPAGTALAALAVLGVRWLELPRPYDAAFVAAMTLTAWGEALRLYDAFENYDVVVHTLVPFFGSQLAYVTAARADLVPDPADETTKRHYAGIGLVTLAFGMAMGAIWELLEYASDARLDSSLQLGLDDTMGDLAADLLGSALGGAFLVVWAVAGWGTVRRTPDDASPEELARARETGGRD